MVLGNFLDNPRAEVACLGCTRILVGFVRAVILDVLVNPDLLSHDALNVNLVCIVVVLDQSSLDGFLETLWVHREVLIGDECVYFILRLLPFLRALLILNLDLVTALIDLILLHTVGFGNDFAMASGCWEAIDVLLDLVA